MITYSSVSSFSQRILSRDLSRPNLYLRMHLTRSTLPRDDLKSSPDPNHLGSHNTPSQDRKSRGTDKGCCGTPLCRMLNEEWPDHFLFSPRGEGESEGEATNVCSYSVDVFLNTKTHQQASLIRLEYTVCLSVYTRTILFFILTFFDIDCSRNTFFRYRPKPISC